MTWKYLKDELPPDDKTLYQVAGYAGEKTKVLDVYFTGEELQRAMKRWGRWRLYAYGPAPEIPKAPPLP